MAGVRKAQRLCLPCRYGDSHIRAFFILKSCDMTVTKDLVNFGYESQPFRTIIIEGSPHFVAKDVCKILGISRTNDAIKRLDADEKLMRKVSASDQGRTMWLVNESGLYNLIFRSTKPEAQAFRKWVTGEVLPALRKSGTYQVAGTAGGGAQLTLPFIDADYYMDQVKREMMEVALRVSPGSRAGKFLKLIKPLVYGAKAQESC